jgi:hypothetical protein
MIRQSYNVTLINLTADARSVSDGGDKIDCRGMSDAELRALLANFTAIDSVENATGDPEIRVQVKGQSCVIQAGHKKLILYDALNRATPGHPATVEEVMAELDGTASAARAMPQLARALAGDALRGTKPVLPPPSPPPSRLPRRLGLAAAVLVLAGALVYLRITSPTDDRPVEFKPLRPAEARATLAALAGVYLVKPEPGQHGIVLAETGAVRLFELRAAEPPRQVLAAGDVGRVGARLAIATDQPGGSITVRDPETLVYGNETYRRVR